MGTEQDWEKKYGESLALLREERVVRDELENRVRLAEMSLARSQALGAEAARSPQTVAPAQVGGAAPSQPPTHAAAAAAAATPGPVAPRSKKRRVSEVTAEDNTVHYKELIELKKACFCRICGERLGDHMLNPCRHVVCGDCVARGLYAEIVTKSCVPPVSPPQPIRLALCRLCHIPLTTVPLSLRR